MKAPSKQSTEDDCNSNPSNLSYWIIDTKYLFLRVGRSFTLFPQIQFDNLLQASNRHLQMDAVTHFFNGIANNINGLASNVSGNVSINITLDATHHQKTITVKRGHHESAVLPVYIDDDDISGQIQLEVENTNRYDHLGLKCYLIGHLQIFNEPHLSTEFTLLSKELQPAGYLATNKLFKFKFSHFDKDYESFRGKAGRVRYFIRAALNRNVIGPLTEEEQFAVLKVDDSSKMEITPTLLSVGVDDRLHIQFLLQKNCYHVKQWVQGSVKFLNVKMAIAKMEISLIRRQSLGTPDNTTSQSKVLETFEVMDGCPGETEVIPFRMCMRGVKNLTPSYRSIHNRLFVRHWFMVTIYDDSGRRYFKQAEITFYRKK